MPTISIFYGIIIAMFYDDHNPPHFHATYQDYEAIFDLNGNMLDGEMPIRQRRLIVAWATIHQDELVGNWRLLSAHELPYKIDPLR
ncbi:hypothetical protein AUL39_06450 [Tractidigestivibacter scatoligenes]|uniref:DUF4160 domain-containing protein n=1 Tax=Tractidigestivibacter scatoligenes TaxID=1299998 RepID=A0A117J4G5_TRASO|nr:DUF4160 domain-containing protein [Tractidigestivibacter scatoligenes]KUH58766.1 hypothetical protein AUL39_06450 [Tractidigestivibacter scatoligenes]